MTTKTMTMIAAATLAAGAFADHCKCGNTACSCGDDCKCAAERCECPGCAVDDDAKDALAEEETPIVSAEFGLAFDSKYITYGVVDGKDPILTPSAEISFFDTLYFGVESIFDVTKGNGKRGEYGNRAGKWTTLDAIVGLRHDFDLSEDLGALSVDFNYIYEYIRRYGNKEFDDGSVSTSRKVDDTQYLNLELSLGDLWLEPTLAIERDLMADNGTYVNLELGHTFAIVGDEEDPVVTLRPAVGQGFGNSLRTKGYFGDYGNDPDNKVFDHAGLMDTTASLTAEWAICECLTLSAYVACSDYVFDRNMRHAARNYNADWRSEGNDPDKKYHDSFQVYGGLALALSF
ncbi:MAG: hypothetical protein J6W80_00815 [Kiritimatiellae bacterium]|nr:hypothetical protein [Kiritimatiellia bacterium]